MSLPSTLISRTNERQVAAWVLCSAVGVFLMVVLGGYTRLSGSGLSIVAWEPVAGVLPPLSPLAWEEAFAAYRRSPEYQVVNAGMSLAAFQTIYLVEWSHRLLGRLLGVVFLAPFAWFLLRRQIPRRVLGLLLGALVLGLLQAVFGWLMVKSGLVDVPRVSPYRLVLHLLTAFALLALLAWTFADLWWGQAQQRAGGAARRLPRFLLGAVLLTVAWGGFVAGLRAGIGWNTFPLMEGQMLPAGMWALSPFWRNLFESPLTVQFVHRWLAMGVVVVTAVTWAGLRWRVGAPGARGALDAVLGLVLVQFGLGLLTLLLYVPFALALAHQGVAALLVFAAVVAVRQADLEPLSATSSWRASAPTGMTRG